MSLAVECCKREAEAARLEAKKAAIETARSIIVNAKLAIGAVKAALAAVYENITVATGGDFAFDLQLFAMGAKDTHRNNERYIDALKAHEGNALAYCLRAVPYNNNQIKVIIDTVSAEVNPLTESFLVNGVEMQNLCGRTVVANRGFVGYAVLDVSALAGTTNAAHKAAAVSLMVSDLYIGSYKGQIIAVQDCGNDNFVVISEEANRNGNRAMIKRGVIFDGDNNLRGGWLKFGAHKNNGASKGRRKLMDMFADDYCFEEILDKATYGEHGKSLTGEKLTGKELADKLTRIGSKSTRMGSRETLIKNIWIFLDKAPQADGAGLISSRKVAEQVSQATGVNHTSNLEKACMGYLIQSRPYTAKGAVLSVSDRFITENVIFGHKPYVIDVEKMTKEQEEIIDLYLDKTKRSNNKRSSQAQMRRAAKFAAIKREMVSNGYDSIYIVNDPLYGPDLIGDFNLIKDCWDYTQQSGINVLNVAHFDGDFFSANTSGQLLKVVMTVAKENPEMKAEIEAVLKGIIDFNISDAFAQERIIDQFDGSKPLDLSYVASAYRTVNPDTYMENIGICRSVLSQEIDTINRMINRDRYAVPGHPGMITVDPAFWTISRSLIDIIDNDVIEVIDPVMNRYYKEEGLNDIHEGAAIKYPSMGTKEALLLVDVMDNYVDRVKNNEEMSNSQKENLIELVSNLKEGAVLIPDDLDSVAKIAAGSDEDGDKFSIFFKTREGLDLPTVLWKAGFIPNSVNIQAPENHGGQMSVYGDEAFARYQAWNIMSDNKSVGIVTNVFAMFTMGLSLDLNDDSVLGFYRKMFIAMGVKEGNKKYRHVIYKNDNGDFVAEADCIEKFFSTIENVKLDSENVLEMLKDLDVIGRFTQECTIDAQKKFYSVFCAWMDNIQEFKLINHRYGINFEMKYNSETKTYNLAVASNRCYKYDNGSISLINDKIIEETVESQYSNGGVKTLYSLVDAFAPYRVYAANKALLFFEKEFSKLEDLENDYKSKVDERQARLGQLSNVMNVYGLHYIKNILRYVWVLNDMYNASIDKLSADMAKARRYMPYNVAKKMDREIQKSIKEQYKDAIAWVNNELRVVYNAYKFNPNDVVEYIDLVAGNTANKVLKEERFIKLAGDQVFRRKVDRYTAKYIIDNNMAEIDVYDGKLMLMDVVNNQSINLMDGKYTVETTEDGKVYLTRKMGDYVTVPECDSNVITMHQKVFGKDAADLLNEKLVVGETYTVTAKGLMNSNGEMVAPLYFGQNRALPGMAKKESLLLGKRYLGKTGRLVNKAISPIAKKNTNGKEVYNYVISLEVI